jgi:hypothetical protein
MVMWPVCRSVVVPSEPRQVVIFVSYTKCSRFIFKILCINKPFVDRVPNTKAVGCTCVSIGDTV